MSLSLKCACEADPWCVHAPQWDPQAVVANGNLMLLGNGYMGYRGTLEEFGAEQQVGILLNGLYDQSGSQWREPVNAPNGLFTRVSVNGTWLNPLSLAPVYHRQWVDMANASHHRETHFTVGACTAVLKATRFLSATEVRLSGLRWSLHIHGDAEVLVESGIDATVWDLNGPHLTGHRIDHEDGMLRLAMQTVELAVPVVVAEVAQLQHNLDAQEPSIDGCMRRWQCTIHGAGEILLDKAAVVVHGGYGQVDSSERAQAAAVECVSSYRHHGWQGLYQAHCNAWNERWNRADCRIIGDADAQLALRYSIYQLLIAAPFHSDKVSIPARALSGQVYKGAVFWDTEIFMLPFFIAVFPEVARNLLRYRIHSLPGARAKAAEMGYSGAYYPWESQENGHEACTFFNITDVFTQRPMRTYFRDRQIHISADIVYAFQRYLEVTGDLSIIWDGGFAVVLECARFFLSRSHRQPLSPAFVLLDVTGPDEYHERVDNNAFTNHMAHAAVLSCLHLAGALREDAPQAFQQLAAELGYTADVEAALQTFADQLYLPDPDPETAIIQQFDGYEALEDTSLAELKSRILHPDEYLGGGNGLATTTRILKQADVVLLMLLQRDRFPEHIRAANFHFYEPRTEHGSTLSACAYALLAADLGQPSFAWPYFLKTAAVDLTGKAKQFVGDLYIGGTHPAANGGAWWVATEGFAGVRLCKDGLLIQPQLPSAVSAISFSALWRGLACQIAVSASAVTLTAANDNPLPMPVLLNNARYCCHPGQTLQLGLT
jgi:trehalose/maltose hydrolase-like predicted phosphorylase